MTTSLLPEIVPMMKFRFTSSVDRVTWAVAGPKKWQDGRTGYPKARKSETVHGLKCRGRESNPHALSSMSS
jgi:hypothetical protein